MTNYFTIIKNDPSRPIIVKNYFSPDLTITFNDFKLELLAVYLYTYFPPRQRRDYYEMIYINTELENLFEPNVHPTRLNPNHNYITSDKQFIFNNYKNSNRNNLQVFDCTDKIFDLIKFINY